MPFGGLVDSGANDCCFPGSIAGDLGHDLEKGKERIFEGVGGEVKTYLHQNYIQIQDVRIRGDLYFSDEWNDWGFGLLGRHGFFTHFKVIFDYRRKIFTIEH